VDVTPAEARTIAKEAYVYGFPLVDSYRIQYGYFVDRQNPEFKTTWNQIHNTPRVYTPADTAIQTPNSDTPYSWLGMDLRAEPIVVTVPPIEKERYFTVQLIDAYTFNFAYIGSRHRRQRRRQLPDRGPGLEGTDTQRREGSDPRRNRIRLRCLSHAALQSRRPRQRQESAGRLQSADAVGVPWHNGTESRTGHQFHQAAHGCRGEDLAAVLQHPELRPAILPDRSVRNGTHGTFRQDWRRRGNDHGCQRTFGRNEGSDRTGYRRRLGPTSLV
jgi:hypothetical protein